MHEDGDLENLAEGTSKEDLVGLCQRGYGDFWLILSGCSG